MAEPQQPPGGQPKAPPPKPAVDLSPDVVISRIFDHFKEPQAVTFLIGYLGESPKGPNHVRFYLDLDLDTYCDILRTDIVHREMIQRPDDANASKVFLSKTAKLTVVSSAQTEVEASFLKGSIASSHPTDDGGEDDGSGTNTHSGKHSKRTPGGSSGSTGHPCHVCKPCQ